MESRTGGGPAGYGQACMGCARAKCRCIYRSDGNGCERYVEKVPKERLPRKKFRCYRLRKECVQPSSTRRRNVDRTPRRRERLEDKLDHLVNVLMSQQSGLGGDGGGERMVSGSMPQHRSSTTTPSGLNDMATPASMNDSAVAQGQSSSSRETDVVVDVATGFPRFTSGGEAAKTPGSSWGTSQMQSTDYASVFNLPAAMAQQQLDTFFHDFLPHFPFFNYAGSMSALELRQRRPFLWLVIMSLTTKSVPMQVKMGLAIRKIVMEHLITDQDNDIDILLGLLCFISWSHYHKKEKFLFLTWSNMAVSMAYDLGLHKGESTTGQCPSRPSPSFAEVPVRTMEERRAFLATFILSSMTWTTYRKMVPLRWTPYLDECVRVIATEGDNELDALLVACAKFHHIMNQMTTRHLEQGGDEKATPPPQYFFKHLQSQIDSIRHDIPPGIHGHDAGQLVASGANVVLCASLINASPHPVQPSADMNQPNLARLQNLETVFNAVQQHMLMFKALPLKEGLGITMGCFAQFTLSLSLLFRLSTLRGEPGWDPDEIKSRINLFDVLDREAERLDTIADVLGLVGLEEYPDYGILLKAPKLLRGMKIVFLAEMKKMHDEDAEGGNGKTVDTEMVNVDFDFRNMGDWETFVADVSSDPWLEDIFGSWF